MALIRSTCEDCGDVELRSREIQVLTGAISNYRFRCPVCRMTQLRPADQEIVDILVSAGCATVQFVAPVIEIPVFEINLNENDLTDFIIDLKDVVTIDDLQKV